MPSIKLGLSFLIGLGIWFFPKPDGVSLEAWHLFALFSATILGLILRPYPMPVMALMGLASVILTNTLTLSEALSGFSKEVIWLIVFSFFIAYGIIHTGLGTRVSYLFMALFGKSPLGLSYGLGATDLLLAPAIPSSTARAGGILLPIVEALSESYQSSPRDPSQKRIGSFLITSTFQMNVITNAMFLTAMAGNPLVVDIAQGMGIHITWTLWAVAASIPGLLCLLLIPPIVYYLVKPTLKKEELGQELAKTKLRELGPLSFNEGVMVAVFFLLITLWIGAHTFNINPTTTALLGVCILLGTGVVQWPALVKEEGAWSTLIWFSILVMMASSLNKLGFMTWFSDRVVEKIEFLPTSFALLALGLIYFYSHYFFASNLAHIGAMFSPFLAVAIKLGAPPLPAALMLGYLSSLFGGLTHYGSGPSAVLYGPGYVPVRQWWGVGLIVSFLNLLIWGGVGLVWWKVLGLW